MLVLGILAGLLAAAATWLASGATFEYPDGTTARWVNTLLHTAGTILAISSAVLITTAT